MIFDDNTTLQFAVMDNATVRLHDENKFLREQNQEIRDRLKELEVSLTQAIGPRYENTA